MSMTVDKAKASENVSDPIVGPTASVVAAPVIIADVDFNELLEIERTLDSTSKQYDKTSGNIKRLEKDLDVLYSNERNLVNQIEAKRRDFIRRYKIDEKRQWRVDFDSHQVVYAD